MSLDRDSIERYAYDLDRLRDLVRKVPTPMVAALEQARACGRAAYEAGVPLDRLVETAAMLVPKAPYPVREFPRAVVEAVSVGYAVADDGPTYWPPDR